ncbi:MAG: response regulator, partial [Lachnospiraceae bacterium]|nr:response regulator [Lachnospiraceae bacterium]
MIRSLLNITDISTFAMAVTACAQLILSAAVVSVALYLYFQNRTVRAVGYYTASTVALFGRNLFYAINYLFADSVVAAASLRLAAEGCMITYLMILIYYVGEVITGEGHTTFNINRASKVIFAVFWLIFGARGVIYPEGGEDPTAYIRLVRLFRFPVAIFIIAVVIYIIRMLFEWKTRIRFKRSLSVYWMFGNFCAVAVVAALLDIVFPIGGLIDTFQFSALAGTLSSPLLAIIAVSYLNTRVSVENASRLLRGEIPTPLFTVNGESDRIAVANDAAMRFLGKTREELIGHTLSEFFDTEIDEKTIIRRSLGEAKYYFDKGTVRGTKIPCSFVASNIHDRFGEPFCCLIFVYDKSNEEEMIERLKESALSAERANSARGMFLANMSHEIRTPMNAIIGMAEIGLREAEQPQVQEELRQIRAAGNGLLEIINDILDFSKIESGTLEIVNAGFEPLSMINDLVNIVRQKLHDKKLEFIVKVNPRFPSGVLGDEGRIKQVLLNILNNAVKYTDEGCVQLAVDFENQDNGILMQVEIRDSGIGIKEEEQANLFKSYNQLDVYKNRNKEGTGLGLSISKRLVDMMDGAINVSSIYGQGSTFSITIPLEVTDYAESISVNKAEQLKTATFLKPSSSEETFRQLLKDIGISGDIQCTYPPDVLKAVKNGAKYIFIDEEFLNSELLGISGAYQDVKVAVITNDPEKYEDKPYISMQRPEFGLRLMSMFGEEKTDEHRASTGSYRYDFKAPGARVLIVDDNAVNLSVAEGLLKPFKIQVDTVLSGEEAVKQVVDVRYDIVFMDHMMPGMDGVAATRHIREELGDKELI